MQICRKGLQNTGFDGEEVEFAFAPDENKPRGFKFFYVVRERGRRNVKRLTGIRTAERTGGFRYALEQFEPLGVGEGLEDYSALGAREPQGPGPFRSFDGRSKIFHSHGI